MKKITYIFFLFLSVVSFAQNAPEEEVLNKAEVMPVPPYGNYEAFYRYVGRSLQIPKEAYQKQVSAECMVRFMVDLNGIPGIFKITGGIPECPSCEKSAINVIKNCPLKWTPGMQGGKPVKVYVDVPIRFDVR